MEEYHYPDFMPKEGDLVLVRDFESEDWRVRTFISYRGGDYTFYAWRTHLGALWAHCAPYPNSSENLKPQAVQAPKAALGIRTMESPPKEQKIMVFDYASHQEMWKWIARQAKTDHPSLAEKCNWPGWKDYPHSVTNNCFACHAVREAEGTTNCDHCPLQWKDLISGNRMHDCLGYNGLEYDDPMGLINYYNYALRFAYYALDHNYYHEFVGDPIDPYRAVIYPRLLGEVPRYSNFAIYFSSLAETIANLPLSWDFVTMLREGKAKLIGELKTPF